ncbi:MAG: SET domain-containing protein-lysine N-methyltransferase [Nanoarchaeota archaeon]|nr:SET domain-containing protein-lysine N-methyltransferase [Nanoarchaeota archaeon]
MDVIIKKSKIEGEGVFAARDFKKGEIVIKWDISYQLSSEEAAAIPEKEKKHLAYTNGKIIVQQPPAKYVNHACNPNTQVKNFCDVAIRDIKKGEEITSDYSSDLEPGETMKCNCGSKNCKRIITAK